MSDAARLLGALVFAAERHKEQRRKDLSQSPYINHPLSVAFLLATEGGVDDVEVLMAAALHDTVEDTATTETELRQRFGERVTSIVVEVTDDKSIPKALRKQLQVERAPEKSTEAALVKLADKCCNLRDVVGFPPADWSLQRRQDYFDWALRVVERLPLVNERLRAAFDEAYAARPATA